VHRMVMAPSPLSILILLTACVSSSRLAEPAAAAPASDSSVITRAEIDRGQWSDTYELVRNLRPRWVESRGPDTILGEPGKVQVYVDGMRLGAVDLLRSVPTSAIQRLAWVDPVASAGRWGPDHAHGVIEVSYRPADNN
jgi:outer membrane cobalamin receptor